MKFNSLPISILLLSLSVSASIVSCQSKSSKPEDKTIRETSAEARQASQDIEAFIQTLPDVEPPSWDEKTALELVAFPLSCIDRVQKRPEQKGYLYKATYDLRSDNEGSLAFYGCSDWHSAVNSIWTMVRVLKDFPKLRISKLIREKLINHLSKKNMEGELAFFRDASRKAFERPLGWAYLLKLYAELCTWDDPDARHWAENIAPLAKLLSERTIEYLNYLSYPMRTGAHDNTAFSLTLMLEYARVANDRKLENAIIVRSKSFFANDINCPAEYEPSGGDFLSRCLAEAVLMSYVFAQEEFIKWFDRFMPPLNTYEFQSLAMPVQLKDSYLSKPGSKAESDPATKQTGAKSHLIGLSFYRAAAMNRIAAVLPENDSRRKAYRKLAALHGQTGFKNMNEADYFGTHWLANYAVLMLTAGK